MLKSLKLFACTSALGLMAVTANAASVSITPNPDPFDFGNVLVGGSVTHTFNISFIYDTEESYIGDSWSLSPTDVFTPIGGNCFNSTGCTIDITFSPTAVGPFSTILTSTLEYFRTEFCDQDFCVGRVLPTTNSVLLTGNGIAPVPLPAALPLLGGALSTLGLFGWRRRRRKGWSIASFDGNPASASEYKSLVNTS